MTLMSAPCSRTPQAVRQMGALAEAHVYAKIECACRAETISVWVSTGSGIQTVRVEDGEAAHTLYEAGHSVYCRAPLGLEERLVKSTVRALGLGWRGGEGSEGEVGQASAAHLGPSAHCDCCPFPPRSWSSFAARQATSRTFTGTSSRI
jgi:hypothetical protein